MLNFFRKKTFFKIKNEKQTIFINKNKICSIQLEKNVLKIFLENSQCCLTTEIGNPQDVRNCNNIEDMFD